MEAAGPVTSQVLVVSQEHAPNPDCVCCGGTGTLDDGDAPEWCYCRWMTYRTPTPADLVAHVVALPVDERQAVVEGIAERDPWLHVWRSPKPVAVFETVECDTEEEAAALAKEYEADSLRTTPEYITKYVAGLPADEARALLVALLRARKDEVTMLRSLLLDSPDLESVLSCRACGEGLVMHVQRAEHDGFGNETAPRRVWLECPDHNCDERVP